jgi:hypothetical protein
VVTVKFTSAANYPNIRLLDGATGMSGTSQTTTEDELRDWRLHTNVLSKRKEELELSHQNCEANAIKSTFLFGRYRPQ